MNRALTEIEESDVPELTAGVTRAFDDDAKKHLGMEKGGPGKCDNGNSFRTWSIGHQWTVSRMTTLDSTVISGIIVWVSDDR